MMPQIECMVTESLFSKGGEIPIIKTVNCNEIFIQKLYKEIKKLLTNSIIPVNKCVIFKNYEIFKLNIENCTTEFFNKINIKMIQMIH